MRISDWSSDVCSSDLAADTDADEAAHDVVDPLVGGRVGVAPALEEEGGVVRRERGLLREDPAHRHLARRPNLLDSVEAAERADPLEGERAHAAPSELCAGDQGSTDPGGDVWSGRA